MPACGERLACLDTKALLITVARQRSDAKLERRSTWQPEISSWTTERGGACMLFKRKAGRLEDEYIDDLAEPRRPSLQQAEVLMKKSAKPACNRGGPLNTFVCTYRLAASPAPLTSPHIYPPAHPL